MIKLKNWEYVLPFSRELHEKLEKKRQEYKHRMEQPTDTWSSWQTCDLSERHSSDRDFRLLYYKFVIISAILLANERHDQKKILLNDDNLNVESRYIYFNLYESLDKEPTVEIFETACEVVNGYITGKLPFD